MSPKFSQRWFLSRLAKTDVVKKIPEKIFTYKFWLYALFFSICKGRREKLFICSQPSNIEKTYQIQETSFIINMDLLYQLYTSTVIT